MSNRLEIQGKTCPGCGTVHQRQDGKRRQAYCHSCHAAAQRAYRARMRPMQQAAKALARQQRLAENLAAVDAILAQYATAA